MGKEGCSIVNPSGYATVYKSTKRELEFYKNVSEFHLKYLKSA